MTPHARLIACLTTVALTSTLLAQAPPLTLHVGDPAVSGARLQPYDNAWQMSAHYPDGRVVDQGIWTDMLRARDLNGRKVLVRTQGLTYANGMQSMIINMFDPATLAPISSETRGRQGRVIKRTFSGAHLETHMTPPGGTEQMRTVDLPTPVFDFNGGMYGLMFAAQTLSAGMSGTLPSVNDVTDDYDVVPFRVVRRERIRADLLGDVDAWVVESGTPVDSVFWIIDRAPYIVKLVSKGASADTVWEMIR